MSRTKSLMRAGPRGSITVTCPAALVAQYVRVMGTYTTETACPTGCMIVWQSDVTAKKHYLSGHPRQWFADPLKQCMSRPQRRHNNNKHRPLASISIHATGNVCTFKPLSSLQSSRSKGIPVCHTVPVPCVCCVPCMHLVRDALERVQAAALHRPDLHAAVQAACAAQH